MSIIKKIQQLIEYFLKAAQRLIEYILAAVSRIFSPNKDEYPATGIQPFEGEIPERETSHKQSW